MEYEGRRDDRIGGNDQSMSKQLLIYQRAVAVNPRDHKDISVKAGADFEFAKEVNSVPLMAVEFDPASIEYPIGTTPTRVTPR